MFRRVSTNFDCNGCHFWHRKLHFKTHHLIYKIRNLSIELRCGYPDLLNFKRMIVRVNLVEFISDFLEVEEK